MIYWLLISAWALMLLSFAINKRDIIAPSFLFTFGFAFAITWATVYADKWELNLHANTFGVIVLGMAEYVLVSGLVQWWMGKVRGNRKVRNKNKIQYYYIPLWVKFCVIIFTLLIIAGTVLSILRIMGYSLANVMLAITLYHDIGLYQTKTLESIPSWVMFGRVIVQALGYWFLYVFINNLLIHKRDWCSLLIVVLAALSSVSLGSRGDMFFMIISGIVLWVIMRNKERGFKKAISTKMVVMIGTVGLIVLLSFRWTASIMARYDGFKLADYIAIYCGAEIKNLDLFLQETNSPTHIWGGQTFINLVNWLNTIVDLNAEGYTLDLPFRYINGFNLGNVYTTFYPYIYDFGIAGLIVLVGLMAALVQWNYERVKRADLRQRPTFCILLYSYMAASVFFSFFSNKFYENMASVIFFRVVLFWLIFNWLFCGVFTKIKIKRT